MKSFYLKMIEKFRSLKNRTSAIVIMLLKSFKNSFSFHNSHTELLAIWTILFMTISGLFILAIKSNFLVMFLLLILAVLIMSAGILAAVYYLHALKYRNQKSLFHKIHNLSNKSFKLRTLFNFIKIPRISILSTFAKNLRIASLSDIMGR